MVSAYLYLTARTTSNRIVRQLRRVRNPRYAIAIVLGIAYVWFFLFARAGSRGDENPFSGITSDSGRHLVTLGVFALFASAWVFGKRVDALAFSPAEVYFLFPAPVTRRGLIIFKLLRLQLATLISTLIWVVLMRSGSGDLPLLLRGLGLWLLFSTLSMHRIGAALVQASITQHGVTGLRKQRVVTSVLVLVFGLFAWAGYAAWRSVRMGASGVPLQFPESLFAVLQQPLLHSLLQPFRVFADVAFASGRNGFLSALPLAGVIAVVHFIWVITANTAFEEAAVEASAKLAKRITAFRERGARGAPQASAQTIKRTSLPLSPIGHPAVAIVWKNALAFLRSMRAAAILVAFLIVLSVVWSLVASGESRFSQAMVIMTNATVLFWTIILGPRFVRNDLRVDLAQLSLLKTYPLPGSTIVSAEVASATLSLTVFQLCPLLIVYVTLLFEKSVPVSLVDRSLILAAAPLLLLGVNSVNFGIQNGAAVMFPAWMSIGPMRPTGVEALGQNLLLAFASMLLLVLALLPAAIVGVLSYFAFGATPLRVRLAAALITGLLTLFLELAALMHLVGRLFDRTEPSAVT